jgi:exosortase
MVPLIQQKRIDYGLWILLATVFILQYADFIRSVSSVWLSVPEFSFGVLIPGIVTYLVWIRRNDLINAATGIWPAGAAVVLAGCALRVLAVLSGTLVLSGIALAISLAGIVGFVWGSRSMRIAAVPFSLLTLMIPLPSYVLETLTWHLQVMASTLSGAGLSLLGIPVYQDGNLLNLPNYVLEVEQACSGSRSIFALIAMALVLAFTFERKWLVRASLVVAAPLLAIAANVVRIVGTGLLAFHFGAAAANESLHAAWGVMVFVMAVMGLLGLQRILRWVTNGYA